MLIIYIILNYKNKKLQMLAKTKTIPKHLKKMLCGKMIERSS